MKIEETLDELYAARTATDKMAEALRKLPGWQYNSLLDEIGKMKESLSSGIRAAEQFNMCYDFLEKSGFPVGERIPFSENTSLSFETVYDSDRPYEPYMHIALRFYATPADVCPDDTNPYNAYEAYADDAVTGAVLGICKREGLTTDCIERISQDNLKKVIEFLNGKNSAKVRQKASAIAEAVAQAYK